MVTDFEMTDRSHDMLPCKACKAHDLEGTFAWRRKEQGPNYNPSWDLLHWHGFYQSDVRWENDPNLDRGMTLYGSRDNKKHLIKSWNKANQPVPEWRKKASRGFDFSFEIFAAIVLIFFVCAALTGNLPSNPARLPDGSYLND